MIKIFLSWSGKKSGAIAKALDIWLPKVIQEVETFYSPGIEKGTKGLEVIHSQLEDTSFGIICLTPDNLKNNWIHYEAGALAKLYKDNYGRVWTFLSKDLNSSNVVHPLAQFQHTLANKDDIHNLLKSINEHLLKPLSSQLLGDTFDRWWPDLEKALEKAEKIVETKEVAANKNNNNIRPDREVLNEVLELLRSQDRQPQYLQFEREFLARQNKYVSSQKSLFLEDTIDMATLYFTMENSHSIAQRGMFFLSKFSRENPNSAIATTSFSDDDEGYRIYIKFKLPVSKIYVENIIEQMKLDGIEVSGWN